MKIFAAALVQETNTFSPLSTTLDDFTLVREVDIVEGNSSFDDIEPFSRWLQRACEQGCELLFGGCFFAQPSGPVALPVYEGLRNELLAELVAAGEVDIVLLYLHGAMVAYGIDDCEGDFIQRVRTCVGEDTVIAVEIDLHAHLTDRMLAYSDLIISFKEYPHIDIAERGAELFDHAISAANRRIKPAMAVFDCKMMGMYPTSAPVMKQFVDSLTEAENRDNVLSVSFVHGFPFGDVEQAGAKMLVVTNDDPAAAKALADKLGKTAYAHRYDIGFKSLRMQDALNLALTASKAAASGPVVVADQSDNVGAGAPGDATYALEWLLNKGGTNAALGIFYDPDVVAQALLAGPGQTISVNLGGKMGSFSGNTLELVAAVSGIKRNYNHLWPQRGSAAVKYPAGDVIALRYKSIDIIVSSKRVQCFAPGIFADLGVDVTDKDVLIVKSTQHFQGAFSAIASRIIYMAAPGAVSPDILAIPYKKMPTQDKFPWNERNG
ncbi:M81 family metallopeptidase [Exilibacterium tricleocarpae]|uniref:Microcystinase C n=1 Tax=Exilibacterium tricleocarpae TaxID=2591008 RepID=A0A545SPS3_9GAMM|nr:M81 family metallopeptidase [Exilibacterium tricleocarpae]TQV66979.1 M81 family metallopeptidase [Exilibacterium tricleocarpae]